MKELKTLKDYDLGNRKYICEEVQGLVIIDELRQEAIKWCRELKQNPFIVFSKDIDSRNDYILITKEECAFLLIEWIKFFFNITESEEKLKQRRS